MGVAVASFHVMLSEAIVLLMAFYFFFTSRHTGAANLLIQLSAKKEIGVLTTMFFT